MRQRMLLGKWITSTGTVYSEFKDEHIIEPFKIPVSWERFRGVDFGYDHPFGTIWIARNPDDGKMYIYREYKQPGKTIDEHVSAIKKLEKGEFMDRSWADHSAGDRAYLTKQGIITTNARKDVLSGITAVKQALKSGMLYVFNTCYDTIDEFYSYEWKELKDNVDLVERVIKLNDDLMDPLRYIIYSLEKLIKLHDNYI